MKGSIRNDQLLTTRTGKAISIRDLVNDCGSQYKVRCSIYCIAAVYANRPCTANGISAIYCDSCTVEGYSTFNIHST